MAILARNKSFYAKIQKFGFQGKTPYRKIGQKD
jgi:hypothetical protein